MTRGSPPGPGLRLDELARELPAPVAIQGDPTTRVTGVHHDSRRVEPGDLFVARRGAKSDGVAFLAEALGRGAAAVLTASGPAAGASVLPAATPALLVDDPGLAFAHAASAVYGQPSFSLEVVGITGTNGKTTTAHLVRAAVDGALGAPACGVIGTLGHAFGDLRVDTNLTTPEPDEIARAMAAMRARGASHVAMEVSSHALELGRVRAIRFLVAALTNLTQDHLDFHGTMDQYRRAKERLFFELGPATAVINVDDPFGRELAAELARRARCAVVRVGARADGSAGGAPEIAVERQRVDARGIRAEVQTPRGLVTIDSRLVGPHNLDNLLLALGVAHALELDVTRAADALSRAGIVPGRLERCDREGDDVVVVVDYAHTPDALARVLDALRGMTAGRLFCVFGCGGDRDPKKRVPMGEAVGLRADVAIVTNDNPRTEDPRAIAEAVVAGVRRSGREPVLELDRRKAIALAVRSSEPGDVVLVAGKGHEDYQIVGNVKHPFDDRLESRRALDARRDDREDRATREEREPGAAPRGGRSER